MIQENKIKKEKERAARLDSARSGQPRRPMHALGHNLAREKPDPFCLFILFGLLLYKYFSIYNPINST